MEEEVPYNLKKVKAGIECLLEGKQKRDAMRDLSRLISSFRGEIVYISTTSDSRLKDYSREFRDILRLVLGGKSIYIPYEKERVKKVIEKQGVK